MKMVHTEATEQLREAYLKTLNSFDLENLYKSSDSLSGIFLPSVPIFYCDQVVRVMLVGQQPKAWRNATCAIKTSHNSCVSKDAVSASIASHADHSLLPPGKVKLLQFYKKLNRVTATKSENKHTHVVWSNLFAITHNKKTPVKSKSFNQILALSKQLLIDQITVLQPNVIIFTTGHGYDKYIKDYFVYSDSVCHETKQLWQFNINKARCFRTHHPCVSSGNIWRTKALELISQS